jgi:hypothetical protein
MSETDYLEPSSWNGEVFSPDADVDYLILEAKPENVAVAVQRLNAELSALIDLLSSHDESGRKELTIGFVNGLSLYAKNQTKASTVVGNHCPEHLRGKLLDIIMFVRSRMNAVDAVTGDNKTSAYCIEQVLDLF